MTCWLSRKIIPLILLLAAIVEESSKCLGFWASTKHFQLNMKKALIYGSAGGAGFFLIEKGSTVLALGDVISNYSILLFGGLLIPLLLHIGLGILYYSLLTLFGRKSAFSSFILVAATHFIINWYLVGWIA